MDAGAGIGRLGASVRASGEGATREMLNIKIREGDQGREQQREGERWTAQDSEVERAKDLRYGPLPMWAELHS